MRIIRVAAGLWMLAAWLPATQAEATLQVTPIRGLVDEPFIIRVEGANPGTRVRVHAELKDDDNRIWTAVGEYVADATGAIDTATAASLAGTYEGVQPGGLACSALPVPRGEFAQYVERLRDKPSPTTPKIGTKDSFTVRVSALGVRQIRERIAAHCKGQLAQAHT